MEKNTTIHIEPLLDVTAVATAFQVSKLTLRRLWQSGQFPAPLRIGRRSLRWRLSEIESWIQQNYEKENHNAQNEIIPRGNTIAKR